jgi:hypothetical protein
MIINIAGMSGIAPAISPHALQPNQAQIARNCKLWSGGIESINDHSLTFSPPVSGIKTIYRFMNTRANDSEYWFAWNKVVNVVKGAIAGDTDERTYFTGTGRPRKTSVSTGALSGQPYPNAHLEMGVPRPEFPPIVSAIGAPEGEVKETRAYVYTYLTSFGGMDEESFPSPAVLVEGYPGSTWTVSGLQAMPTGEFNFKGIRVYRLSTGNASASYLLAAEKTTLASFQDVVKSTDLGSPIPSLDWDNVPGCSGNTDETRELLGLIGLPNGVNAGFVGQDVYLTPAYKPHTFPQSYMNTVHHPIVALSSIQSNLLVLTTGQPYLISVDDPSNTRPEDVNISQACVSAQSVAKFGSGVLYASPDGLVYVGTDGAKVITEGIFSKAQWEKLNPASMHGCQFDGRYYGWFSGATLDNAPAQGGFIFGDGQFIITDTYATASYVDLVQDSLFVAINDKIYKWESSAGKIAYLWRSRLFKTPMPASFTVGMILASDYADITFRLYCDGVLKHTQVVTSGEPFRLPTGFMASQFELEVAGTSRVMAMTIAESMEELGNV